MAKNNKYTIPAKPTKYKGRLYRSRLEARVAALFDLLNYEYEYEPFDLPGWSPDFLIKIKQYNASALVEVKPDSMMFDITKYKNIDFDKYEIYLISPEDFFMIGKRGVSCIKIAGKAEWVAAGNEVMFLKPEVK